MRSIHNSIEKNWSELIFRGVESDTLDYKAPMNWKEMNKIAKGKIVRHALAFANTKGGCIVIGVAEDNSGRPSKYIGLSEEQSRSFDPTIVGSFINRCVDPPIDFNIERVVVDGKNYAILVVKPFTNLPHVCVNSVDTELSSGVFYVRTVDASSRPAHRSVEMQAIIQRALRNQREVLGRMLRGILYEGKNISETSTDDFHEERKAARFFFERRRKITQNVEVVKFEFSIAPDDFEDGKFSYSQMHNALEETWNEFDYNNFISNKELENCYTTNTSLRSLSDDDNKMWQLFCSGMFHYIKWIPLQDDKIIDFNLLKKIIYQGINFCSKLYMLLGFSDEMLNIKFKMIDTEDVKLNIDNQLFSCHIPEIFVNVQRSASDLDAGVTSHSRKIVKNFAERFNVPSDKIKRIVAK